MTSTARSPGSPGSPVPAALTIAALGVVFGDIGTSPLYTLKVCFKSIHVAPTASNAVGIASLLVWTLFFVVCIKYITVLMRVDHDGEGGILALLARAKPPQLFGVPIRPDWLVWVAVVGGAMILGDGMITPAISVISAVEGLNVATPSAQTLVVPISAGILIALFAIQWRGTQGVGLIFGPVMILWFAAIAVCGLIGIAAHPTILSALNPVHAFWFVTHHGTGGFLIFGAIILGMTGAEALYADMSHFGRLPITVAWYAFVFPALIINYIGQAAVVAANARALDSPFYALSGGWTLLPMVALATAATIIASQSLISGAFTLTEQAIALNLCPRMAVMHTSKDERGQVYVPLVNVMLAVVCIVLVVSFRSSDRLAAMFGLAVAVTMLATDVLFYVVATRVLRWRLAIALPVTLAFGLLDATFVAAGLPKFIDGAWVPVLVAAVLALIALTWLTGRRCVARELRAQLEPIDEFLKRHPPKTPVHDGAIVLLSGASDGVPFIKAHPWLDRLIVDRLVVLLTITFPARPYVSQADRITVETIASNLVRLTARFGYMEVPRISPILHACEAAQILLDGDSTSFVYATPVIVARRGGGMRKWQGRLFAFMERLSRKLATDLEIKPSRQIEIAVEVTT